MIEITTEQIHTRDAHYMMRKLFGIFANDNLQIIFPSLVCWLKSLAINVESLNSTQNYIQEYKMLIILKYLIEHVDYGVKIRSKGIKW